MLETRNVPPRALEAQGAAFSDKRQSTDPRRLRLLVLAEENNPDWISVPLVGFYQTQALAQLHDLTLITHVRNLPALSRRATGDRETIGISLGALDKCYTWIYQRFFAGDPG